MSRVFALGAALIALAGGAECQVDVVTRHNNNARTGQNLAETILNTDNVNAATFGKLAEYNVGGRIWAQPLLLSNVATPEHGVRDIVYVVTQNSRIFALDAKPPFQLKLAERNLVEAPYAVDLVTYKTASVSCPVIDRSTGTLYVTVKKYRGDLQTGTEFWLHALDLLTLADKTPPVHIQATVPGTGSGSVGGFLKFNPYLQKQRPALLLAGGVVYAAFGGSVDVFAAASIWNGWIFGFDANSLERKHVRCIAPNANGGGVWQGGNGLAADENNHIYAVTGTGNAAPYSFSVPSGGIDLGNCILRLVPNQGGFQVGSFFAPFNYKFLESADRDVGSSGPMLMPDTNLVLAGDKMGRLYVADRTNMGGFTEGSNRIQQDFQAWAGHLHGTPVYWNGPQGPTIYGWPEHDYLKAYRYVPSTGKFDTTPVSKSTVMVPPGMPGGTLALSANGNLARTGIVWSCAPYLGDANTQELVPGIVRAYDAADLTRELWNSRMSLARDDVGNYAKFATPTVANGRLYVPTFSDKLVIYGQLPALGTAPSAPTLAAVSGLLRVDLSWPAVPGATIYTLQRSQQSSGPFLELQTNLTAPSTVDLEVQASKTYFYRVQAANSAGHSGPSAVVPATPYAPAFGTAISINFVGGGQSNGFPQPLGATEKAGAVPLWYWNSAAGAHGQQGSLRANGAVKTNATVTWQCPETGSNGTVGTSGDARMMKGYLATTTASQATIQVGNLPTSITTGGYDLYVYSDGTNFSATRETRLQVAELTRTVTDPENRDFEGIFHPPGVANVGNYTVFTGLVSPGFQVVVSGGTATDASQRAAINGLQIVARQGPPLGNSVPQNLVATPYNGTVELSWMGVTGGTAYVVKRAQSANGPFVPYARTITSTYYDTRVANGTAFYYQVVAEFNGSLSPPSNIASAVPLTDYSGRIISVNFGTGAEVGMAPTEVAGAANVARKFWNVVRGPVGGLGDLKDDLGGVTTADITCRAQKLGSLPVPNTAGNNRMMGNFITTANGTTQVDIYNLPPEFVAKGYDLFVYTDLNNPGAARPQDFVVNGDHYLVTDAKGQNFSGRFVVGNGTQGNMVKICGLTSTRLTLTAHTAGPEKSVGAPINGLQLVARNNPSEVLGLTPSSANSLMETPVQWVSHHRDGDGADDLQVWMRIGSAQDGSQRLQGLFRALENKLFLCDENGIPQGTGSAPGSRNTLVSPLGTLNCAETSVEKLGTDLKIRWSWTPSSLLVGTHPLAFMAGDAVGNRSAWHPLGSWTVNGAPGAASPSASAALIKGSNTRN